jgi:hypothetical protein
VLWRVVIGFWGVWKICWYSREFAGFGEIGLFSLGNGDVSMPVFRYVLLRLWCVGKRCV